MRAYKHGSINTACVYIGIDNVFLQLLYNLYIRVAIALCGGCGRVMGGAAGALYPGVRACVAFAGRSGWCAGACDVAV